jgi:hypothetical protein
MRSWPGTAVPGRVDLLGLELLDPLAIARVAADLAPPRRSAQTLDQQRIAIRDPGRDCRERGVDVAERQVPSATAWRSADSPPASSRIRCARSGSPIFANSYACGAGVR